ncbi:MAG: hypothetical protein EXS11_06790 [Gemmataceae bacterium]|nr:hypothetical protein [Gemmataceae bacterium]
MSKSVESFVFGVLVLMAAGITAFGLFQDSPPSQGGKICPHETAFVTHSCCALPDCIPGGDCCLNTHCCDTCLEDNADCCPTKLATKQVGAKVAPCHSVDRGLEPCCAK